MHLNESSTHFDPSGGTITPGEKVFLDYLAHREQHPLPAGWGESYHPASAVPCAWACYLENPDFYVRLWLGAGDEDLADHCADFRIQGELPPSVERLLTVVRKDATVPTIEEVFDMCQRLFEPHLATVPDSFLVREVKNDSEMREWCIAEWLPAEAGPGHRYMVVVAIRPNSDSLCLTSVPLERRADNTLSSLPYHAQLTYLQAIQARIDAGLERLSSMR